MLLHRTVGELNATMSNPEYLQWRALGAYRAAMKQTGQRT